MTTGKVLPKIRCKKCRMILESKYTHDFQQCPCGTFIDGGGQPHFRYGWPGGDVDDWIEWITRGE